MTRRRKPRKLGPAACGECGKPFAPRIRDQSFCTRECKQTFHNRGIQRGNRLYPLVYRWRALRSSDPDASNAAFSQLCAQLSLWIDEDRRAGRAVPTVPAGIGAPGAVVYMPPTTVAKNDPEPWYNQKTGAGRFKYGSK